MSNVYMDRARTYLGANPEARVKWPPLLLAALFIVGCITIVGFFV